MDFSFTETQNDAAALAAMVFKNECTPDRLKAAVGPDGRFDVAGSYLLRAYPVTVGPTVPARFVGRVTGATATVTVTVNDTIERRVVVRGPVTVRLGETPSLGPCPICRRPVITRPR